METSNYDFEDMAEMFIFTSQGDYFPGPGDEDGGEEEDNSGDDDDKGSNDDNPPLDNDVVHSPLTTDSGGKPKK